MLMAARRAGEGERMVRARAWAGWAPTQLMGVTLEGKRLGIAGDWVRRYATMDFPSEAVIAGEIGRFLMNGALYRGLRPVMWSPVEKTALAEAEIEYHDHTSTTVTVRFPIVSGPVAGLNGAAILIWTTTPWTMPGNRAIALGEDIDYAVVRIDSAKEGSLAQAGERVLVALDSNHTHDHVLAELEAYAPLTSVGSYCVVFDTIVEDLPKDMFPDRPWGPGNNPKTAVWEFLKSNNNFEIDTNIQNKLLVTVAPDGYLKRIN
jgi:hypothetical protein